MLQHNSSVVFIYQLPQVYILSTGSAAAAPCMILLLLAAPDMQMALAVTGLVSAAPCIGRWVLLGLVFTNALQMLPRMVSFAGILAAALSSLPC